MLRQAVVSCALLAIAAAFLEQASLEPIPEKFKGQEGCFISELDKVVPFSQAVPGKIRCVEYRCSTGGVRISGCSAVAASPPCKIVEDKSASYPNCCPQIVCP